MVSFDFDSLCTKMHFEDVLKFLSQKLPNYHTDLLMPTDTFIELFRLCISSSVFSFGSDLYMQYFTMSPVLSNVYMNFH